MNYDLGKFQMRLRGSYSTSATYDFLDVVYYNGGSYCSKADGTKGKVPTNTTYWQQIAAAGQSTLTPAQKAEIVAALIEQQGIVIDPDYNQFTAEEKQKLAGLADPNNGTLTITYEGRTIATFKANQSTNTTLELPSTKKELFTAKDGKDESVLSGDCIIRKLRPNAVYVCEDCTSLTISDYVLPDADESLVYPETEVYVRPKKNFTPAMPDGSYFNGEPNITAEYPLWKLTCQANIWKVESYKPLK